MSGPTPMHPASLAAHAAADRAADPAVPDLRDAPLLMTLGQAAALLPGATLVGDPATPLLRVHSDTRSLRAGDCFVALRGERFDAHDFLPQARAAGAVAALAERGLADEVPGGLPGLKVADSLAALQQLAAGWRARHTLPLIAVTGSNGKTTVTQMLAAILRAWVGEEAALATAGNYNNHIGVPLQVLRLHAGHRAAVLELGMNHPGEIARLAAIAQPTVALVNNAQREHQEFMASVEAVAEENGQVIAALPADGVAVYPTDDAQAPVWQRLAAGRRCLGFSLGGGAEVTLDPLSRASDNLAGPGPLTLRTPRGEATLVLHAPGRHNQHNALAAAAAALAAGAPLQAVVAGLQAFRPVAGRSQLATLTLAGRELLLVDDSYNANPDSVRAAIDLLAGLPGPHWLLLGDMGEVGDQGPAFHAEVGAHARARGIGHVWCAGLLSAHAAQAYGDGARHFADTAQLVAGLGGSAAALPRAGAVLVKGSRFMRMEQVVQALQRLAAAPPAAAGGAACC